MKLKTAEKSKIYLSITMVLIALIVLATGTYAWFTLSLTGKINSMELKVTAGDYLRVDVEDRGNNIEDWDKSEITVADIEGQLKDAFGATTKLADYQIDPVTSGNGKKFYRQSGTAVTKNEKAYLQFDLYFIASKAMSVYLTESDSSASAEDGTLIKAKSDMSADKSKIDQCVRVSFDVASGDTSIYEPNKSGSTTLTVTQAKTDAGGSTQSTFTNAQTSEASSKLFTLAAGTSKKVTVTIWIEGDDAQCTDGVKLASFLTRLRFEGV